jgi:hypothetical protein
LDLPWDVTDDLESSERYAKQKKVNQYRFWWSILENSKNGYYF